MYYAWWVRLDMGHSKALRFLFGTKRDAIVCTHLWPLYYIPILVTTGEPRAHRKLYNLDNKQPPPNVLFIARDDRWTFETL